MQASEKKLRLGDIFYPLFRGWRIVLSFTLAGMMIGILIIGASYIKGELQREYRIKSSVVVVAQNKNGTFVSQSDDPNQNDIKLAEDITDPTLFILKSNHVLNLTIEKAGLIGVKAQDIKERLEIQRFEDTQIVEIALNWRSESEGIRIMTALEESADAVLLDSIKAGRIYVLDTPKANLIDGSVNIALWFFTAFAGFMFGAAFCIVKFLMAPTVINEKDVEDYFGVEVLGTVPLNDAFSKKEKLLEKNKIPDKDIASISHILLNRLENAKYNKIYFTSTENSEGNTVVASLIALCFAQMGKKTLLIDCNFANPAISAIFKENFKKEKSLNALYLGEADVSDAITTVDGCLDILPLVLEKNPPELNSAMLDILKSTMAGYDYILIDASAIGENADVLELNRITDAVVFNIAFDQTYIDDIKKSIGRLEQSGIPILGSIVNFKQNWRDLIKDKNRKKKIKKGKKKKSKKEIEKKKVANEK